MEGSLKKKNEHFEKTHLASCYLDRYSFTVAICLQTTKYCRLLNLRYYLKKAWGEMCQFMRMCVQYLGWACSFSAGVFIVFQLQSESVLAVLQLASLQQPVPERQQRQPRLHRHPLISLSTSRAPRHVTRSQPRVAHRYVCRSWGIHTHLGKFQSELYPESKEVDLKRWLCFFASSWNCCIPPFWTWQRKAPIHMFWVLGEYHPPPSPPTPGKEEGERGTVSMRRGSDGGKLRGRKKVSDPALPLDADIEVNTPTVATNLPT